MISQLTFKNLMTTLLVSVLIGFCTMAQNNGLPAVINFSNYLVEEVVDQVVSESVRVRRSVQYQKQRDQKPDLKLAVASSLPEHTGFVPADRQIFESVYRCNIVRGPPAALI